MESGENKSKILTDEEKKIRETTTIKPDHIYWRKKLPRGFQYYMERLMRGIVRVQPSNIPAFAAVYLEDLLEQRNKELENLPEITYLHRIENNMKQPWYGQDPLQRTTAVMQTSSTLLHKYLKPSEYSQTGELPKSEGIQVNFPKEEGTQTDTSQINWASLKSPAEPKRDFLGEHGQTSGIYSARNTQCGQTQTSETPYRKTTENMYEKTSESISENTAEKKPEMHPCDDMCDHKRMRFYCHPPPYHSFIRLTGCSCAPPPRQPHLITQPHLSQNASATGAPYAPSHPGHHICPCGAPQTFDYNKNQVFSSRQPQQDSTGTQDHQFHMEALEEPFMELVGTHMHAATKDRNHKVGLQQTQFDSSNSSKNFVSLTRESTTYRVPQSEEPDSRLSSPPYVRPLKRDMATSCSQFTWSERIEPPTSRSLTPSPEMQQSRQKKHCRHHHHHHHHCQHRHRRGKSKQRKKETAQSQTQPAPIYQVYQMPPWLQQPVELSPPFTWPPLHTPQQLPGVSAPVQVYNPFHPLVIPPVQVNVGYPLPAALQSEVTCGSCARRALDVVRSTGLWKDTRTCHFCHPECQTREVATQNEDLTNIETVSHRVQQVSQKSASTCFCGHKQTTSLEMKDELTISYRVTTPESGKDSHILSSSTTQNDLKKIKAEIKSSYRSVCLQCSSGDPVQDQPSSMCSECSETIRLILGGTPSTPSPDGKPDQVGEPYVCAVCKEGQAQRFLSLQESKLQDMPEITIISKVTTVESCPETALRVDYLQDEFLDEIGPLKTSFHSEVKMHSQTVPEFQLRKTETLLQKCQFTSAEIVDELESQSLSGISPLSLKAPLTIKHEDHLEFHTPAESEMRLESQTVLGVQLVECTLFREEEQHASGDRMKEVPPEYIVSIPPLKPTTPLSLRHEERLEFYMPVENEMKMEPLTIIESQRQEQKILQQEYHTPVEELKQITSENITRILPLASKMTAPLSVRHEEDLVIHMPVENEMKLEPLTITETQWQERTVLPHEVHTTVDILKEVTSETTFVILPPELEAPLSVRREEHIEMSIPAENEMKLEPLTITETKWEERKVQLQEVETTVDTVKKVTSETTFVILPPALEAPLSLRCEEHIEIQMPVENEMKLDPLTITETQCQERKVLPLEAHTVVDTLKKVASETTTVIPPPNLDATLLRHEEQIEVYLPDKKEELPQESITMIQSMEIKAALSSTQEDGIQLHMVDEGVIKLQPQTIQEHQRLEQEPKLQELHSTPLEIVEMRQEITRAIEPPQMNASILKTEEQIVEFHIPVERPRNLKPQIMPEQLNCTVVENVTQVLSEDVSEVPPLDMTTTVQRMEEETFTSCMAAEGVMMLKTETIQSEKALPSPCPLHIQIESVHKSIQVVEEQPSTTQKDNAFSALFQSVNELSLKDDHGTRVIESRTTVSKRESYHATKYGCQDSRTIAKSAPKRPAPKVNLSFTVTLEEDTTPPNDFQFGSEKSGTQKGSQFQKTRFQHSYDEKSKPYVRSHCQVGHSSSSRSFASFSRLSAASGACSTIASSDLCISKDWEHRSEGESSLNSLESSACSQDTSDSCSSESLTTNCSLCPPDGKSRKRNASISASSQISFAVSLSCSSDRASVAPR